MWRNTVYVVISFSVALTHCQRQRLRVMDGKGTLTSFVDLREKWTSSHGQLEKCVSSSEMSTLCVRVPWYILSEARTPPPPYFSENPKIKLTEPFVAFNLSQRNRSIRYFHLYKFAKRCSCLWHNGRQQTGRSSVRLPERCRDCNMTSLQPEDSWMMNAHLSRVHSAWANLALLLENWYGF